MATLFSPHRSAHRCQTVHCRESGGECPNEAFALVIALSLLAFILLLLMSLVTFVQVESKVSQQSMQQSLARQNAILGMQIALGELQKYTGPDQRTTARADILSTGDVDGTRHWTGVWGNQNNPQSDTSSNPVLLQWLVSGNENRDFSPVAHVSSLPTSFGQIAPTVTDVFAFRPDQALTGLTGGATPGSPITLQGTPAALMVGPGTAGDTNAPEGRFVVAPLVEIGAASSAEGRYAFWVGDEGVKSRMNLVDPYVNPTGEMVEAGFTAEPDSVFRLMFPQRSGVERVSHFSTFPVNTDAVRTIHQLDHAVFLDETLGDVAIPESVHDLTGVSYGVISDSRKGGLKRDLSYAFAQNMARFHTSLKLNPGQENPVIPTSIMPLDEAGPTWEQIYSYANLDGSAALEPTPQTSTDMGIYPVLTQVRFGFGGTTVPGSPGFQQFILHVYPAVVLANPYNAPLAANTYRIRMDVGAESCLAAYLGNEAAPFWRMSHRKYFEGMVLELDCPEMDPGEALVFTLASSPADEIWSAEKVYPMVNDWDAGAARITLNTANHGGAEVPDLALLKTGSAGIHPVYGDSNDPAPGPQWSGSGGTYTPYRMNQAGNGSQRGGTQAFTLTDEDGAVYQRIEIMGYAAWPISQYGMRALDNTPGTTMAPDSKQGVFIFRLCDSGSFDVNFGAGARVEPYYAHFNWRAPLISRTAHYASAINSLVSYSSSYFIGGKGFSRWILDPDTTLTNVEWNGGVGSTISLPQGRQNWQPFDIPRDATGLVSMGQLQHFNAAGHLGGMTFPDAKSPLDSSDRPSAKSSWRPRYIANPHAIGNSAPHPNIARSSVKERISNQPYYDFSYLLNRELFDGYFFSTVPQVGPVDLGDVRLSNSRMSPFRANLALDAPENFRGVGGPPEGEVYRPSRNLILEGPFNINSTSVEAWKSLLSSFIGTEFNEINNLEGPYLRSIRQPGGVDQSDNGISEDAWNGFRDLDDLQIGELANQIVLQIKRRGASLSVSDFVNRRLVDNETGLGGPLREAIEAVDATLAPEHGINSRFPDTITNSSNNTVATAPTESAAFGFPEHLTRHSLEGIAGWLSQADIIQALGSVLMARSDTFRIRAYGEALNEVTQKVEGRAWCEAIVQRLPDYVDPSDDAIVEPGELSEPTNVAFGRRYEVIGFRWLSADEI